MKNFCNQCQYAKDVGMPEYRCDKRCYYSQVGEVKFPEILMFLLCAGIGLVFAFGLIKALTMPVVEFNQYGRCLKVQNPAPGESCTRLPKRYRSVTLA